MNNNLFIKISIGFLIFGLSTLKISAQGAQKIGENPFTLNPSAIFEIESSTKGFLPPRMTRMQMVTIPPTKGLMVYCTDCSTAAGSELMVSNGVSWVTLLGANLTYNKVMVGNGFGQAQERATTGSGSVVLSDSPVFTGTPSFPLGTTGITPPSGNNSTLLATTAFVNYALFSASVPDATTTGKGKVQLAGDLTGTADSPIIANSRITTSKILDGNVTFSKIQNLSSGKLLGRTSAGSGSVEEIATTGTGSVALSNSPIFTGTPTLPSGTIGVTQVAGNSSNALATTEFVSSAVTIANIADATTTSKGKVQLAGDLTGTADLPIIANNKVTTAKVLDANITYAKIQNVATGKILGRTSTGSGIVQEIPITGTGSVALSNSPTFTGTPVLPTGTIGVTQSSGDNSTALATTEFVTNAVGVATIADATTTTKGKIQLAGDLTGTADLPIIADNKIITSKIVDANVTYAKIQNVTSNKILGRTSSGSGNVEEIATTGSGNVVLSNAPTFTGAIALPSGSTAATQTTGNNSTEIATTAFVTNSIALSTIPDASTTTKGKIQLAGDLTGSASAPIIANDKIITSKILDSNVTYAKIQNVTPNKILGRTSLGEGVVEEIATTGTVNVVMSDSPTFTGTPVLPSGATAVTQTTGDNSTAIATTEFVTNSNATNANLTGDVTSIGNATTLSASGVAAGTYGNNLSIPVITVDAKGRITTLTTNTIAASLKEESVEYTVAVDGETSFELSHVPSQSTLVRMYINGVLISQSAGALNNTTMTYFSLFNGDYNLTVGDRIQFYYYF
jgi:hypothetical protein